MPPPSVPVVGWDEFCASWFTWRQGEHVSMIGPTGSGKTTLALAILPMRDYVIAYGTKPHDDTLTKLIRRDGWRHVKDVAAMPRVLLPGQPCRIVFWPPYKQISDQPRQAFEIATSMNQAFIEGGWCLFEDEVWYLEQVLGLKRMHEALLSQGRSNGISVVGGTQRPAFVSLLWYDQPTHVFFWRDNDERNLKRISGMNGLNAQTIRATVSTLPRHAVLYVNTRTGVMVVTRAPK